MPYPMVHFAIALELCSRTPSSSFLIGSIAPDAVHVRGNVTRSEKGITHFVCEERFPSIEVLKERCQYYLNLNDETNWKDYILGYFAHIYADIRWTETVYSNFEREYRGKNYNIE
ncbi:zinc dependent phospholipase C family protein [Paenibacillus sp. 8b26]|uniref:zinc dependent phospholipase C family protein n=1 Tax=Paenibacillus sp. 8b26 TaxID=3424133 RepID=UPI003D64C5F6